MKNDRNPFLLKRVLVLCTAFCASASTFAAEEYVGQAVSVSGKVLMRAEGSGNGQMAFLKAGDKLYKGTIVNTGSNGAVKLLMTDRTIVDLGPSSLFKVNEYQLNGVGDRHVDLSLDYGQVRTSVNEKLTSSKGKFTIRTKAATMGVRGTEFVVSSPIPLKNAAGVAMEPPKTSLTVMHGKVEVADPNAPSAQPVAVTPGLQYAKSGDGPGAVANLGMEGVTKVKSEAMQKDMTFLQTVSFDANTAKENNSKANESAKSEDKVADKGGEKSDKSDKGDKSEKSDKSEKKADASPSGGNQTLASISMNVESQSKEMPPPAITDLKLPGTFTPEVPQSRPIDQLNGRMVNLRVRICPPGSAC